VPEQGDNIHVPPIYTFTQEAQGRINSSVLWTEAHLQNGIPPVPTRNARPGVEVMWGKMDAEVVAFDASAEEVSSGTMTIWDLNVEEAPYTFAATSNTVDVHNLTLNTLAADTMIQVHRDPKTDKWFYNSAAAASSGIQYLKLTADMTDGSAAANLYDRSSDGTATEVTESDDTYIVKDELNAFKYSKEGASGYGYLIATEDVGVNKKYTYAPILFETQCQFFTATCSEAFSSTDESISVTGTFEAVGSFPFTQVPEGTLTVYNDFGLAQPDTAPKKIFVGWNLRDGTYGWQLLSIEPEAQDVVTDIQLDTTGSAPKLVMKKRSVYVISSEENPTTFDDVIFTATECSE